MLDNLKLKNVLFLDIETVPQYKSYENAPERARYLWSKKAQYYLKEEETPADVYQRAGIYSEFGKIVCISVGIITGGNDKLELRLKSFADEDEEQILKDFIGLVNKIEEKHEVIFCAHNGKEFDFPYISRRCLINGLSLPGVLNNAGKKPWEIKHIDTLELWKFGDYKHYTSLDLLTYVFNIPSPKEEIDGSMVADVFYKEKDIDKIIKYCENDVIAIAQLLLRYMNRPIINESHIERTIKR
jgi:DNA polymerase elongation subunit (family B)